MSLATGLLAADPAISLTPATLPLADGAKIVIQGVRCYTKAGKSNATEALTAGYVRPVAFAPYAGSPGSLHLLAQDETPTAANVFTVTAVARPATFPPAKSFGPDYQFVVLQAANGKYLCFLEDDMLGASGDSIEDAQVLLVDKGDPFGIFITPLIFSQHQKLATFLWPAVKGTQLLFWRMNGVVLCQTHPHPTETPSLAGAIKIFLVQ